MSFFDDASLVMIPSGYKDQKVYSVKPTDGTGDLTFSRASSATRVASNGLIEKVRTNLILYSEQFNDASWASNLNASVSANAAVAPNGTTTADKIVEDTSTSQHFIGQSPTSINSVGHTISVYAKAAERSFLFFFEDSAGGRNAYFDLSNGTIGNVGGSATASITSVGNGWYRCSVTYTASGTLVRMRVAPATANGTNSYTGDGTSGIFVWGAQVEVSDFGATDYIPTTTAAVSVGPVSGLPRLDYLGSTCPRLLLEPQRSNLQIYSENSALWQQPADGLTVVYNTTETLDPAGFNGAEKVTFSSGNGRMFEAVANALGSVTMSAFVKAGTGSLIRLRTTSSSIFVDFNLTTQTITSTVGTGTITNYGNGWYRVTATGTTPEVAQYIFPNSAGQFVYFWGAQFEDGAYATSYIPTLGASVTRVADAASKTGISSLIGQTEGTLFVEATLTHSTANNEYLMQVSVDGDNRFFIYREASTNKLGCFARVGASTIFNNVTAAATTGTIKAAFAYKSGSFAFYVNGVQVAVSSSTYTTPASMGIFNLDSNAGAENGFYTYAQALLFKTRLTNSQLAELTA
jgi:hypothetical protein